MNLQEVDHHNCKRKQNLSHCPVGKENALPHKKVRKALEPTWNGMGRNSNTNIILSDTSSLVETPVSFGIDVIRIFSGILNYLEGN